MPRAKVRGGHIKTKRTSKTLAAAPAGRRNLKGSAARGARDRGSSYATMASGIAASMEKQFADFEAAERDEREKFFGDALVSGASIAKRIYKKMKTNLLRSSKI